MALCGREKGMHENTPTMHICAKDFTAILDIYLKSRARWRFRLNSVNHL